MLGGDHIQLSCIFVRLKILALTWVLLCSNYDPYLSHTAPVTRSYHSTRITRVTHFILNPIPCRYVSVHEQLVMFPPLV
jgi:hypothetical protein